MSAASPGVARPAGVLGLLAAVFLAGAGTMVVELSAVRVLAPWFGASAVVWTNVIGVVLLALALGYLLGARLSSRPRPLRALGWALLAAGLFGASVPLLARVVAGTFLPGGVTLDRAAELIGWGSLASALLLFLPAAAALGCVGPLAVELVQQRSGAHAGTAGGRVLFASTLGSLLGTFGATHVLVPRLGIAHTFLAAGALLALLGALLLWRSGRGRTALGLALAFASLAPLLDATSAPAPDEDVRVLATQESPYQSVRVVERGDGPDRLRLLQVNEGFDSFQSVWQPEPGLLPWGYYYDYFALPPHWEGGAGSWRVCVLGLGAGTAWRVLEGSLPAGRELDAVGVEIDPVVVALGREWMDLPPDGPRRRVLSGWDARAALARLEGGFDQVVLDAYANQVEIPAHLSSLEFFEQVRASLRPGGWLGVNVGGFGLDDPVVRAVGGTLARAFGRPALGLRVPSSRNLALIARRDALPPEPGSPAWRAAGDEVQWLLAPVEIEGAWRWFRPQEADPVLTDDHNPIERLQRLSLRRAGRAGDGG